MKRYFNLSITVLFILALALPSGLSAQSTVRFEREVPEFHGADLGGAFNIYLQMGERQKVEIEIDRELEDKVMTEVKDGILHVTCKTTMKKIEKQNLYVTFTEIDELILHGATDSESTTPLTSPNLFIKISGASDADLILETGRLESQVSGASTLTLAGKADEHITSVSGAATLRAYDLVTGLTNAEVSGAATAKVYATETLVSDVSGAGDIQHRGNPANESIQKNIASAEYNEYGRHSDTSRVNVAGVSIEVVEDGDNVDVKIGNRQITVNEDGNVKVKRHYKRKFNGHWAGFDIGLNGYVDKDFKMNFPKEYEYLDLRMEKSVVVNINFYEQNVALSKNKRLGLVTGLGINLPNYRFSQATHLRSDSGQIAGYIAEGISVRKSKLSAFYLSVPLIFEWQSNSYHKKNSFHFGAGMIASARLLSWTKVYYNEQHKEFDLTRYNPATGTYEAEFTSTSPGYSKVKNKDDFYLQPFKFDATVRIGWGFINLWATYSVNTMFRDGKGPELYPWSAGITLVNF